MSYTDDYADSGRYSKADQQRRLAQLLAAQGSSTEPIASGWQGAAKLAQALAGVLGNRAASRQEAAQQAALVQQIAGGLGMLGEGGATPDAGPATTGSISGGGGGGGIGSDYAASGAKDVYQAWLQKGLNPAQAAAFTASWDQESGFNPSAYNAGEGAIGQGQWRGPRAAALKQFAAAQGKPWNDRGVQMDFALNELRGSEAAAGQAFFAARTPEEANQALKQYIRYGDKAGPAGSAGWDYRKRLGNTQRILQQYAGGGETAALPGVVPVATAPSPDVMKFLGGGGQQPQPAGLQIGEPTAPIPQPRPPLAAAVANQVARPPQPRPNIEGAPLPLDERMNAGGGATPPIDPRIAAVAAQMARPPQPRPVPPPAIPQARPNPPAAMLPLQPPAGQPVPPPPLQAPPIQPPAAPVARTPVPRPAPAVASPVVPSAAGPATTAAVPQQRGQIFREPYPSALSAQEFARQGQNYLTGRPSFADQQRVAPRTMQGGPAPVAPAAAAPVSPRQGLIQRLFGGGGGGGAAAAQAAPAGSPMAGAGQPVDAQRMALARVLANPNMPNAVKAALIERLSPKPPDPYTLSPGQTRYGPGNQPLATVPAEPEKPTADIGTYNAYAAQEKAAGRTPKSIEEWTLQGKRAGAQRTTAPPQPGYRNVYDADGNVVSQEVIPGSPADTAKTQQTTQRELAGGVVVSDIDRALSAIEKSPLWTTGFAGKLLGEVGGTGANDVRSLIDTIRANVTFDKLQAMRQASPTGGALGAVSDQENKLLGATIGSLDQSQSDEQLKENLKRVKQVFVHVVDGLPMVSSDAERNALPLDTIYIGSDGLKHRRT